MDKIRGGCLARRRACRHPTPLSKTTATKVGVGGSADKCSEAAPETTQASISPCAQREGRHSSRQGANTFDKGGLRGIRTGLVAHEPAPQLIVFARQ